MEGHGRVVDGFDLAARSRGFCDGGIPAAVDRLAIGWIGKGTFPPRRKCWHILDRVAGHLGRAGVDENDAACGVHGRDGQGQAFEQRAHRGIVDSQVGAE